MKKVPRISVAKEDVTQYINAWVGPLVAGTVLMVIGIALFAQTQASAGKHKKARVRVATNAMVPVAASIADSWNGSASSQQTGNSIVF